MDTRVRYTNHRALQKRTGDKLIFAEAYRMSRVFPPIIMMRMELPWLAHGVLQSREQICRLPSGTRLPSILLERVGMPVRDALSRRRDSHDARHRRLEDPDHSRIH